jgi:hypothetical protein
MKTSTLTLCGLVMTLSLSAGSALAGTTPANLSLPAPQFNLAGTAITDQGGIRLTSGTPQQIGSAYLNTKQTVRNGFNVGFNYAIGTLEAHSGATGEGLAFVIQNQSASATGGGSTGIGATGIRDAVAIVLRTGTVQAIEIRTASGVNGINFSTPALATRPLSNQELRQIVGSTQTQIGGRMNVRYVPGAMNVSINGINLLTAAVNLENINGRSILDSTGSAWLGWTAATSQFRTDVHRIDGINVTMIPTPAAAALLGLGGLVASRRRRA